MTRIFRNGQLIVKAKRPEVLSSVEIFRFATLLVTHNKPIFDVENGNDDGTVSCINWCKKSAKWSTNGKWIWWLGLSDKKSTFYFRVLYFD